MALEPDEATPGVSELFDVRTDAPKLHNVSILVCSTCRNKEGDETSPTPGERLFSAVCDANGASGQGLLQVSSVECLGNCNRRLSAAIATSDCWTYVFGDLQIENGADLVAGAHLMTDTPNGLMPWRDRPQCLKKGMVARIPPLKF